MTKQSAVQVVMFLEDIAHEKLLRGFVNRAATELGVPIQIRVRNATHGSRVWPELRQTIQAIQKGKDPLPDLFLVAIDANCKGFQTVRHQIEQELEPLSIPLVCAIPDPHIERWYLEDLKAWKQILPGAKPQQLSYKCEQDRYKKYLKECILAAGVKPTLGGAEYGLDLAQTIDVYQLGKQDPSFKHFWDELKSELKRLHF